MSTITLKQARRMLPNGAENLAPEATSITVLRDAVMQELEMYRDGTNPLTTTQVTRFYDFLKATK